MRTETMIYNRPRNLDAEWSRWLRQLFHDDSFGRWFPFSLSTRYTPEQLEQRIAIRCRWFTNFKVCKFFVFRKRPELTLNYRKRHGYCAFVLPATSYAGTSHFHGLFRVPSRDPSTWVSGTILQHGQQLTIRIPLALREMLDLYPRDAIDDTAAPSVLGNLHIDNDGRRAIAMYHDSPDANRVLKYWRKRSDGEVRHFDCAFFTPHEIRSSLPIRTGRATASGRPILGTPVGVMQDLVPRYGIGLLHPFDDANQLAANLLEVLSDPGYELNARRHRSEILRQYDWLRIAGQTESVYAEVAAESGVQ